MSTKETENLPYIEDVLAETKTHRVDWLIGAREINHYLGKPPRKAGNKVDDTDQPGFVKIANTIGGVTDYAWAIRKTEADKLRKPEPMPEPVQPSVNGHKEHDVVILKQGSPILSERDGEAIMRGLWDNKLATQNLTKAIDALTQAIKEFKEVMK